MTEETTTKDAPIPTTISRVGAGISLQVDKLDEIAGYLIRARAPEAYNSDVPFTVVPEGMRILDLESHMPNPSRIKAHSEFVDVDSFCRYFNEYRANHRPKIFSMSNKTGLAVRAVLDYHEAGIEGGELCMPRWGDHVADLRLNFSPDYAELRENSGKWFMQNEFAKFVEANLHIFVKPVGADMLEMAQTLRGTKNVTWENGKRLSNGAISIQYIEDVKASNRDYMEVPQELVMTGQIYEGLPPVQFNASFSYDINEERKLLLQYRLLTKLEERKAQEEVKAAIELQTGEKMFNVLALP